MKIKILKEKCFIFGQFEEFKKDNIDCCEKITKLGQFNSGGITFIFKPFLTLIGEAYTKRMSETHPQVTKTRLHL